MVTPGRGAPYVRLLLLVMVVVALAATGVSLPPPPRRAPPAVPVSDAPWPTGPGPAPDGFPALPPARVRARGIYLTSRVAGIPQRVGQLVDYVGATGLNAMVIDLKDNSGTVPYPLPVPLLQEIQAVQPRIADLPALVRDLKSRGIYLIARIVVFQDPVLARARPEWAIRDHQGRPWRDHNGMYWTNPFSREVWAYHLDLAEQAVKLGFDEVQFDYVRFPDNPRRVAETAVLDNPEDLTRTQAIVTFLRLARERLAGRAFLSADVFGLTTTASDDMGIGQDFSAICQVVDYICPMIYPSHYYHAGIYGLPVPEANPYQVVKRALQDAKARARGTRATIRPWLQDFSLHIHYGAAEVEAQIRAAHEEGIDQWLLWNPANVYTAEVDYRAGLPGPAPANELGRVLILEYHNIGAQEGRWTRTPASFRADLERLYREGYRLISLSDYLRGRIDVPAGFSPVVLTFDDSSPGQFRLLEPGQEPPPPGRRDRPPPNPLKVGDRHIDPDCAVGILLDFCAQHPDFGRAATFYVLFPTPFGQADCWKEKLAFLREMGMEIGNHTLSHASLKRLSPQEIQRELALPQARVQEVLPGYRMSSLALPFGEAPADRRPLLAGEHEGTTYRHLGVMLVGAEPAPAPASLAFRPDAVPRVQVFGQELDKWLSFLARHPQERYVSDGNPATLSFPPALADRLNPQSAEQVK